MAIITTNLTNPDTFSGFAIVESASGLWQLCQLTQLDDLEQSLVWVEIESGRVHAEVGARLIEIQG